MTCGVSRIAYNSVSEGNNQRKRGNGWELRDIINADCLDGLRSLPDGIADMCVTSPPYYGLRDYGCEGQIGLEETPEAYIERLVAVFREVWRVLRDDGTLWVNIGDSYAGSGKGGQSNEKRSENWQPQYGNKGKTYGLKPKDLIGIPWMLAFALRADGWYLRQDIIWHKPSPMPESVTDRCTKAHEYIFLLSKSARYYFNNEAIREPCSPANVHDFLARKTLDNKSNGAGSYEDARPDLCRSRDAYMPDDFMRNKRDVWELKQNPRPFAKKGNNDRNDTGNIYVDNGYRQKRNVWAVATKPYSGAHFAVFPPDLIRPCIRAGSRQGGIVLDPFIGSGTTAEVAIEECRGCIGIELNPEYAEMARKRMNQAIRNYQPEFAFIDAM